MRAIFRGVNDKLTVAEVKFAAAVESLGDYVFDEEELKKVPKVPGLYLDLGSVDDGTSDFVLVSCAASTAEEITIALFEKGAVNISDLPCAVCPDAEEFYELLKRCTRRATGF